MSVNITSGDLYTDQRNGETSSYSSGLIDNSQNTKLWSPNSITGTITFIMDRYPKYYQFAHSGMQIEIDILYNGMFH